MLSHPFGPGPSLDPVLGLIYWRVVQALLADHSFEGCYFFKMYFLVSFYSAGIPVLFLLDSCSCAQRLGY